MAVNWKSLWTPTFNDGFSGLVSTVEEAEAIRQSFKVENTLCYVALSKGKHFGKNDDSCLSGPNNRIRFRNVGENVVPYDEVPFQIMSRYVRACVFGKDKHKKDKERKHLECQKGLTGDHPIPNKRREMLQNFKKKQCPAKILMKEVIRFPDFKLENDTKKRRNAISDTVRNAITDGRPLTKEHRIYIKFPQHEAHVFHSLSELTGFMNPLHTDVRSKISELVGQGVTSVSEMRRHIRVFVNSLFQDGNRPASTNAAYSPLDSTI